MKKHILIDADTGIDDSIAILYALCSTNIHVEGITTCFGNAGAAQSAENSLRLVKLSGCGYEVPVAVGAEESIDGVFFRAPAEIHGENGIGDIQLPESEQKLLEEPAWDFICRKAEELQGELILVTTGRMTNLAKALEKDPLLPRKLKKVVSMGGAVYVPGNVSPFAEANIHGDARAADMVFRAGFRMTLVGLDVTMRTFIRQKDIEELCENCREECRAIAQYIHDVLQFYFNYHKKNLGLCGACVVHDPLAMLLAEDSSLGTFEHLRLGAEYACERFQGMVTRDSAFLPVLDREEVAVCVHVDSDKAVRRLFSVFY